MRKVQTVLPFVLVLGVSSANAQQVAYARRILTLRMYPGSIEKAVDPIQPPKKKGSVVVVFRTSEQGAVIDARAVEGSSELQEAAVNAVRQWKFKPMSINGGEPVQIDSAIVIDFSHKPPEIHVPQPMTAQQLSPSLQFKCLNGLLHQDPNAVEACKQQLTAVEQPPATAMDRFTAQDEYGLALMNYAHNEKLAVEHFSQAIQVAPAGLKSSDAEWAYAYWHRAVAEQRSGDKHSAEEDFSAAADSLENAAKTVGVDKIAAHYRALLAEVVEQYAGLLKSENNDGEASQVRAKFSQQK